MTIAPSFAEINVKGADAGTFLQSQLASHVLGLAPGEGHFSCYLNVDGRVQSLCWLHRRSDDAFSALLPADNAEAIVKRLQLYKLRAKCVIDTAAVDVGGGPVYGQFGAITLRWEPGTGRCDASWWSACVEAGIPWLTGAAQSAHLPQALDLQRLSAFSLKKGCYPGQEIVARTHYLGRVKRRLAHLSPAAGVPGLDVMADGAAVGEVVAVGATGVLAVLRDSPASDISIDGQAVLAIRWFDVDASA